MVTPWRQLAKSLLNLMLGLIQDQFCQEGEYSRCNRTGDAVRWQRCEATQHTLDGRGSDRQCSRGRGWLSLPGSGLSKAAGLALMDEDISQLISGSCAGALLTAGVCSDSEARDQQFWDPQWGQLLGLAM